MTPIEKALKMAPQSEEDSFFFLKKQQQQQQQQQTTATLVCAPDPKVLKMAKTGLAGGGGWPLFKKKKWMQIMHTFPLIDFLMA